MHSLVLDKGGKAGLRSPEKVLLENANLCFAVASESGFAPSLGSLRETFFVNSLRGAGIAVLYSKQGDYRAKGWTFEIGGDGRTPQVFPRLRLELLGGTPGRSFGNPERLAGGSRCRNRPD